MIGIVLIHLDILNEILVTITWNSIELRLEIKIQFSPGLFFSHHHVYCCAVELFAKREEKMGAGRAVFMKDLKPRKIKYKKFSDDGVKRLHPARFNLLPTGDPQSWADQNPVKREQVMKNLYMAHYRVGHGQVDTKTIVKV